MEHFMCETTSSYLQRDLYLSYCSSPCVALSRHISMCNMAHSYVWNNSFLCATWLICMGDMAHPHVWLSPDLFLCVLRVVSHAGMRHITCWNQPWHTHIHWHTLIRWHTHIHLIRQIGPYCRSVLIYIGLFLMYTGFFDAFVALRGMSHITRWNQPWHTYIHTHTHTYTRGSGAKWQCVMRHIYTHTHTHEKKSRDNRNVSHDTDIHTHRHTRAHTAVVPLHTQISHVTRTHTHTHTHILQ